MYSRCRYKPYGILQVPMFGGQRKPERTQRIVERKEKLLALCLGAIVTWVFFCAACRMGENRNRINAAYTYIYIFVCI